MSRRLGVDLSSTCAALASVRETRRGLQLLGFAVLDAEGDNESVAQDLKHASRANRFPRRAEVVAWPGDRRVEAVKRSGCRVERVITPGEALARVARMHHSTRPAGDVTAVVSLHLTSGAVAVVRDGRLLFEIQLGWSVAATLSGAESELLRRYTFVSELTESLRRVFDMVREQHSAVVTEILTCGSLADLRSLTMPLAAEFDVEVETLDTTDDVDIRVRHASPQQMRDTIAGLRLAIAAAKRWHKRSAGELLRAFPVPKPSLATRAALVVAVGVIAVFLWVRFERPHPRPPQTTEARTSTAAATPRRAPSGRARVSPQPGASQSSAGSASNPVAAKPTLVARPLRPSVMVRLHPAPRGLPYAALQLALAKAEQAIAPPPETTRAATVIRPATPAPTNKAPSRVLTTPPPVQSTRAARTETPAVASKPPVAPLKAPITASKAPVAPPKAPVAASRAPVAPLKSPVTVSKAPVVPPKAPVVASRAPVAPLEAPVTASKPPIVSPRTLADATPVSVRRIVKPDARLLPAPAGVVVTSILWSSDRQLAVVNDRIVGAGDVIGPNTVVEVQNDAVVFRDRSGRLRRAGLRQGS